MALILCIQILMAEGLHEIIHSALVGDPYFVIATHACTQPGSFKLVTQMHDISAFFIIKTLTPFLGRKELTIFD